MTTEPTIGEHQRKAVSTYERSAKTGILMASKRLA
jgi:hypothetical protein